MREKLPPGKLDMAILKSLLDRHAVCNDERVVVGPNIGEDVAVIDFGEKYLVVKTDPVTFATDEIGWYLVHINANDIACSGAIPRWLLVTLLLPQESTSRTSVETIFSQIAEACRSINVSLVGGHTEVTRGLTRPIVIGQMLGEVEKDKLVTTSGAKQGDEILLTKGIAIEGVALLAREKEKYLLERGYTEEFIEKCKDFIYQPGISVLDEALMASSTGKVTSMHDPTEGGLATGLAEMAEACEGGVEIYCDRIKIYEECGILCREFSLDPLGLIASGGLLLTAAPEDAAMILSMFEDRKIDCSKIGRVVEKEEGLVAITPQGRKPLSSYPQDEMTRVLP